MGLCQIDLLQRPLYHLQQPHHMQAKALATPNFLPYGRCVGHQCPGTKHNAMYGCLMLVALHPFSANLLIVQTLTEEEERTVNTEITPRRKRPRPHTSRNTQGSGSSLSGMM